MIRLAADGTALRSWQIGDVTVTRVEESRVVYPPEYMFSNAASDVVAENPWLKPYFVDETGLLRMNFNSFIVESEGRRIMVDTCVGNDKSRTIESLDHLKTAYLDTLITAGFAPESFDFVLCTHLHFDHVGWNTRWTGHRWVPTFPNARYVFGRLEWEHFSAAAEDDMGDIFGDSIKPVIDADLCEFVETDHHLTGEVHLEPTPGHTPGHVSVRIKSGTEEAVITGDLMHHPLQCAEPQLSSHFDENPATAQRTRESFLRGCCGDGVLVLGSHFADPTGGWVIPAKDNWRFAVERPELVEVVGARKNKEFPS